MATIRLVPSTIYNAAGTNYLTISNADNAYTNTDSTTYATVQNTNASTSSRYIYIRGFNFNSVPSNAIVSSFTVKLKAYQSGGSTNTSYRPYLCNNTTTITGNCGVITTSTQTLSFTGVTADWDTIKGYGTNGADFGIRINCRRNARNTAAYFYIYGAEIEVTYTIPVYHSVTVTGDSSKVNPTGTESVLEGTGYSVSMMYDSRPTVTDNSVDVSSQLVETTGGTPTLIPYDYTNNGFTISNIGNAYHDATNTTYATFDAAGGGTARDVYLNLGGAVIPSSATIVSVSCSATIQFSRNGSSSGVNASCQMYSGNTAKGSSTSITTSATDVAKTTFNLSVGSWTASEIANARFRLAMTNSASNTHRYLYLYGVSFTVTYTIAGKMYIYTLSNITTDHTIIVTAPTAQNVLYVKISGSWVAATTVYKKVSGSWVLQSDLTTVFDSGTNYVVGS